MYNRNLTVKLSIEAPGIIEELNLGSMRDYEKYVNEIFWELAEDNLPGEEYAELKKALQRDLVFIGDVTFEPEDWESFNIENLPEDFSCCYEYWIFNSETEQVYAKMLFIWPEDAEEPEVFIRWDMNYDDWKIEI